MHGSVSGSAILVNAEVDSMGGVIDSGGGIGVKTSPRRAAIEKAQAELRQEYDVREERRRELDFLEKGGNPLDFKFGNTASHSVQSTSLTDQQAEHFVNSEVKDSFALTASPHGDSVESSGRPGVPTVCEPNTADNLLLFDNESLEGDRNSRYPNKRNRTAESERSSKVNTNQNAKETEDSAIFRPYARRNRSRINRDPARSNSTDVVQSRGGLATSLSIRGGPKDGKVSITETANQKDRHMPSISCPSSATSNGNIISNNVVSFNQLNMEPDGAPDARETSAGTKNTLSKDEADVTCKKNSVDEACGQTDLAGEKSQTVSASTENQSPEVAARAAQETNSTQLNGAGDYKGEKKSLNNNAAAVTEGFDLESAHTNNIGIDVNNEKDLHNEDKTDSNGIPMQKTSRAEGILNQTGGDMVIVKNENEVRDINPAVINDGNSVCENQTKMLKIENQIHGSTSELQNEVKCSPEMERKQQSDLAVPENDGKVSSVLDDNSSSYLCPGRPQASVEIGSCMVNKNALSGTDITASERQPGSDGGSILADTVKEDSILEEARIIQAKRQRIAELSFGTVPMEIRKKSHWDFVLEEMVWLANDFAQERLWKMTAAAQICHRVAFTSRLRFEERIQHGKLKKLASTLADAVLRFWSSVEVPGEGEGTSLVDGSGTTDKETSKEFKCEKPGRCSVLGVQEYARRFLKYNNSSVPHLQATAPSTPDNMCDPGILETSWDDQLTEESLFYSVPSGAMEAYRKSIESHLVRCEKSGSSMQEEVETSAYDAAGETGYNIIYDEDEGETSTYYLPGVFECSRSSNLSHKKRKNLMKSHSARSYDIGTDLPYGNYTGGPNQSALMGKRPAGNLNVGSVPTKRMRTASRQRVVSPFGSATAGSLPVPAKTDASSGDTSSFQDEQSSLHGGSVVQRSTEVESGGNFDKQLPYDTAETSAKPKKKKKAHLGSAYDQAWHLDPTEQKDHWKKRSETHNFDLNGLYGSHSVKKQKTMKQAVENNFDTSTPVTGSIPSPAASQMSNMSNPNKFIKLIGGRDRGRKIKGLKVSAGQQGSGNPWSLFEDQALVVLVHDMGPNWELISDAMNSTLKIKCIYRNPSECKERHKILMDRSAGDGADSAEDSGTSQSYPSTLPGIPKGSARQLFQRLQGPMEEDTLKSHFEKICLIGKRLHYRRTQNDARDSKQIVPVHNSQVMALSHVFPNNLNGGVLTPLDLCDATTSGQDVFSLENPGSHPGLPMLNQGAAAPVLPTSGANPSIPGSSGGVLGNLSTTPGPPSASVRDSRFNVPRGSLPPDEQQRLQQYNQMLSGRNLQQPSLSTPGAVSGPDRGHRMVPGGNSMGVSGVNRGTPLTRPGFQGMGPSTMPSSGSMLSPGMVGMPNTGNMHSVVGSSQGNSMLRPREAMQHMMRMQAAQGNSQGIPAFNGLSSGFTNQTTPPVQAYPGPLSQQHQISSQQSHLLGNSHHPHLQSPSHATGAQQQAYAIRQRQMQQRYMQQQQQQSQQQQFPASGALMPHVQPQPQVPPISSSPQNSPRMQPLVSSQPLSMPAAAAASANMTPMAQQNPPQKPQLPPQGLGRNPQSGASGLNSQAGKQRQRQLHQQFQQSGRQHPHQRQPTQGQQQNKLLKGMGRGNMMHQNVSVDPSLLNGLTAAQGIQAAEKGEPGIPSIQGQPSHSGSTVSTLQPSKPLAPPESSNHSQQKAFAGAPSASSQQLQQTHLHSDNSLQLQGQVSTVAPGNILSTSSQSVTPAVAPSNHQHLLPHQKQGNQIQPTAQRILQQNHLGSSDLSRKSQSERTPRDPQSVNNTSQMANASTTMAVPQPCFDSANMRPVVSPAIDAPPKASESSLYGSTVQNAASKVVGSSLMDSAGSNSAPTLSQGLGQQHLPGGLPSHGLKAAGTQRQQPQQQQPSPSIQKQCQLAEQQSAQNQQHFPHEQQQQQPHQQVSQLQAAQGNSSSRPPDAKVE